MENYLQIILPPGEAEPSHLRINRKEGRSYGNERSEGRLKKSQCKYDAIKLLVFQVEAFFDDDGSKNSLEFEHGTEEVANIKSEGVWEWDFEIESKKRSRDPQLSDHHGEMSIFVQEEPTVKNEFDEGINTFRNEELKNKDPLEMKNVFSTVSKSYPRKGKRNHSAVKPYKCDQCGYSTVHKFSLTRHLFRKHGGEKSFKCKQCNFSTAYKSNLSAHMFTHGGEKPVKCKHKQCNFSTVSKSNLTTHMFTHGVEKPYKCDQCGYSTAYKTHLTRHMFTHEGEKPFKCDQCNFSTAYLSNLSKHVLTHEGETLFKCDQCGYRTGYKTQMTVHMSMNAKCNQCGFSTASLPNLTRHKMIHSRSTQDPLRINMDTKVSDAVNVPIICLVVQVKESKASLVTIPINVLSMLEIVKEEALDPKIEDENYNSGYIEDTENNIEMEIKYEPLICDESLSESVAGKQTPELDPPAQADPVPAKSTTDGSDSV